VVSGAGDVLEPEDGLIGIGSGGTYALAAARALAGAGQTDAEAIARAAMAIAADICVYTNGNVVLESLEAS
jgi:ATP-dependent HslUV protease subunit HslV